MYEICSKRLKVQIAEPNMEKNTCRFDRAGFVFQVTLDGKYEYCTKEFLGGSYGEGLCSELKFDPQSETVPVGAQYVKLGVGLITRENEPSYNFMRQYQVEPFRIHTEASADTITFTTEPKNCGGYALAQKKTIRVMENRIVAEYEAENAGEKSIEFLEYVHNFVTLDHHPVDRTYLLEVSAFSYDSGNISTRGKEMLGTEEGIVIPEVREEAAFTQIPEEKVRIDSGLAWKLSSKESGLSVSERVSFRPEHMAIWSVADCVSPEIFAPVKLLPGEKKTWSREWTFEKI